MQNELLIAVLAGLGGMMGWGLADFFAKKTIDRVGDVVTLAWGHVFGTFALMLVVLHKFFFNEQPITIPNDFKTWMLLILFGFAQSVVYLFLYKGFGKGQLAVLSPVFASFSGLTAMLSILVFHESVSVYLISGLVIIFIGILLISANFTTVNLKNFSFTHIPGFKEVVIATILAGLWTLFWGRFLNGEDWLVYTLIMYAFMTIFILLISKIQKVNLLVVKAPNWSLLIFVGLFEALAYLAISLGYSFTSHVSIIALLSGAFSLPAIILARLFLKEKISTLQSIGGLVIIAGIMFLSVS